MKMNNKIAKECIKKLGLEKAHNALKRAAGIDGMSFEDEVDVMKFSYQVVGDFVQKYGRSYRVTMYVLRNDGTAQMFYNDWQGINGCIKQPLYKIKEYANAFSKDEDYVLMVETSNNQFSLVTQM